MARPKPGYVTRDQLSDAQWNRVSRLFDAIARAKKRLREKEQR